MAAKQYCIDGCCRRGSDRTGSKLAGQAAAAVERYDCFSVGCFHLDDENNAWPLKIYTLSRFNLVRYGKKIQYSRKVQQKPLALLKALIALGGRDICVARILDLVWPDMESDISYKAFKIALHRLRRMLDLEQIIRFQDGCLSIDQHECWVDMWAFERLAGRIDAVRLANAPDLASKELARLTHKAFSLYSGNFLAADSSLPWTFSTRERLRSKFVRLVVNAGYDWEKSGAWHRAVECYQKGLEIDDMVEEFYQRLLVCYHRLGKRGEALLLYKQCRTVLAMQCLKPSAKTRAAYDAVINGV